MNKQIRILGGLHAGAESQLCGGESCLVGSDPSCDVVLYDAGVAPRHCVITLDAYGVTCRALEAVVLVHQAAAHRRGDSQREVPPGEAASLEDGQAIQCGPAVLGVGAADGEWSELQPAVPLHRVSARQAVHSLKRLNPYALFATMLLAMTCVIGLAYAALSSGESELTPTRVAAAKQWLKTVAPEDSELHIGVENSRGQGLLLSGYVPFTHQVAMLTEATRSSGFKPRIEVYATDLMVSSMTRLAQLARLSCSPQYLGSGRLACNNAIPSEEVATRLRMIARDVPGLRDLDIRIAPQAAAPPAPEPARAAAAAAKITQKFSVLMFRKQRYLVGRYGKKYSEGDEFDGFRIARIGLDQVLFERDGQQYEFYVAALADGRQVETASRFDY